MIKIIMLSGLLLSSSCSSLKKETLTKQTIQAFDLNEKTHIEVRNPSTDRPSTDKIIYLTVKLTNRWVDRSPEDYADLLDPHTSLKYRLYHFRSALGVQSSNEETYILKLYEDNSLYGITPVYP